MSGISNEEAAPNPLDENALVLLQFAVNDRSSILLIVFPIALIAVAPIVAKLATKQ